MTQTSKLDGLKARVASFGRREEGAVAMVLGIAVVPFFMAAACAIDYGRSVHMNQKFAAAVDAATLAAAKLVKDGSLTDDEVKQRAYEFFKQNVNGHYATFNDADFISGMSIDRANSRIDMNFPVFVPTTFARIAGFQKMAIPQKASAVFALRDIEVGLALDITGSMDCAPSRSGCPRSGTLKIQSLKSAFEKFAKLMLPDNPLGGQKVRLGLAPYSASINLGSYAAAATGFRPMVDDCVTERTGSAQSTDLSPGGVDVFKIKADNEMDTDNTGGLGGRAYYCPTSKVVPLTADRATLINAVNAFNPNGFTAGHIGAQWAWNLVSPEFGSFWGGSSQPDAYNRVTDKKLVKAVILMTDGEFNTAYHNGKTSAQQALALCDEMKKKGVTVFSLAFGLFDATAKNTLQTCASPGADYFVDAADETQLDAAFAQFAGKINALRLAQ